ncbi:MAG TPA: aminopeptidase P family protein [Anaerolineaceae bacterium]|uniref:Putative M24B family peptidase n=1 Tax=Anaerolinea thermophila TaxID=167964 RepID=A0A101FZ20_9CHLR|nr:MAG: Putative M24B family peptidase [Anaerolinea thermophila]HAF62773.1 aminopeptidase P family protein [Anaerolineaceae bacterium]
MPDRIETLQTKMIEKGLPLIAVPAGPDLSYFTGLDFHISERPAVLLIAAISKPAFIYPDFETTKVKACRIPIEPFPYSEERESWVQVFAQALQSLPENIQKVGVNSTQMRYLEMDLLHQANSELHFVASDALFQSLRTRKDSSEVESIRKAIQIAEEAFRETLKIIQPGRTEKEIAGELVVNLLRLGSDPELPFSPIVAAGPNSANPHAVPSDRKLEQGDLVVIDWGARSNHYISDITRTLSIGQPDEKFSNMAQITKAANEKARQTAKAGIPCNQVDEAARAVISEAGMGEYFTHRTGHGIGMEAHEAPYIASDYPHELEVGNTFTIEPGIYLPDEGGVRIEDNILITTVGAETLTTLSRELIIIK